MPARVVTARTELRPFGFPDAEAAARLWSQVGPPLPVPRPATTAEARGVIATVLGLYAASGHGPFAVTVADEGIIGDCGLYPVAGRPDERELGYRLRADHRGHGYATEAAAAVVAAAFDAGVEAVVADVARENRRSQGVVARLGLRPVGRDGAETRYRITARAWGHGAAVSGGLPPAGA